MNEECCSYLEYKLISFNLDESEKIFYKNIIRAIKTKYAEDPAFRDIFRKKVLNFLQGRTFSSKLIMLYFLKYIFIYDKSGKIVSPYIRKLLMEPVRNKKTRDYVILFYDPNIDIPDDILDELKSELNTYIYDMNRELTFELQTDIIDAKDLSEIQNIVYTMKEKVLSKPKTKKRISPVFKDVKATAYYKRYSTVVQSGKKPKVQESEYEVHVTPQNVTETYKVNERPPKKRVTNIRNINLNSFRPLYNQPVEVIELSPAPKRRNNNTRSENTIRTSKYFQPENFLSLDSDDTEEINPDAFFRNIQNN